MSKYDADRANTIYIVGYGPRGELAMRGTYSTFDVHTDTGVMSAALDFHHAARRGVAVERHHVGNIAISTVCPTSDDDLRKMWREAGGSFHGPNVETGDMPEVHLLPLLRRLIETAGRWPV